MVFCGEGPDPKIQVEVMRREVARRAPKPYPRTGMYPTQSMFIDGTPVNVSGEDPHEKVAQARFARMYR